MSHPLAQLRQLHNRARPEGAELYHIRVFDPTFSAILRDRET